MHARDLSGDPVGRRIGAVKDWYFSSAADYTRGYLTQFDERGTAGGAVLRRAQYVYTRDANLMPYVASSTSTIDVGLGSQQVAKTDQTVDVYGNPVQSRVYALNNVATPAKTVNCTFLGPLPGAAYIRNLVSTCSVTNGAQTFSLGSVTYDGLALTAAPGAYAHDPAFGATFTQRGNPTQLTRPGGSNVLMYYNELGEVVSSTVGSVATSYTFQTSNDYFAPTVIRPGNNANLDTSIGYTNWNAAATQSSPNGSATSTVYDAAGRVTQKSNADGNVVNISYNDAARQVTELVGPAGSQRWVRSTADGLGRTVRVETGNASGTKTMVDSEYDSCACSPIGKLKRQSLPYAPGGSPLWVTYVYDGLGRTLQVQQPLSAGTTTTAYSGNKVTVTDPAGRWKTQTSNAFGELVQVTEPNPAGGTFETYYTYTLLGKLAQVSMPRPTGTQNRTYAYDSTWGVLLQSETHPENGTTSYAYLSDGRLNYRQDAKGQRTYFSYDALNRPLSITRTDASLVNQPCEAISYAYDQTQPEYGRLSSVTWGNANTAVCAKGLHREDFDYTAMGRLTKKQMTVTQGATIGTLAIQYAFDNEGKLSQVTYPSTVDTGGAAVPGTIYAYQYDSMGRPVGETYQLNGAGGVLPLVDSVVYL